MGADQFDRWCAEAFGRLLGISPPPDLPPAVVGWPEEPAAGWELDWEAATRALVDSAGTAFHERRQARGVALAAALDRRAPEVDRDTLHRVVADRISIARQERFACDPCEDFWYFKINHGYWEQLYGIFGRPEPVKMRFRSPERYREAYVDSGFATVLDALFARFARDDGGTISFPGMHFGASLEAGNHDHESVLDRFPTLPPGIQAIAVGATIGMLGVFDSLFGPRSLSFADGSFPKLAAMGGGLRDTLVDFARHADRVIFVVPPHLRGLTLDGVTVPQETLPVPGQRVHECWAAALRATVGHVLARLEDDDRVLVITQSAVFAAMLGLFLRAAKEEVVPAEKRIFFFDLGQVVDSATPGSGGKWITRHAVHDPALFRIAGLEPEETNAQR
jgi:hypothetical protein